MRWQRDGLKEPATVRAANDEYLEAQNIISAWRDERLDIDPSDTQNWQSTASELWNDFTGWCALRKEYPGKRTAFNEKLSRCGIRVGRTNEARGICKMVSR